MIILQITTEAVAAPQELTFAELLFKGGVIMIPILILLVIATYISIERYLYIRSVTRKRADFMVQMRKHLLSGDIKTARLVIDQDSSATGRIIRSGLDFVGKPFKDIESVLESAAEIEVAQMEKNLGYLGIIAGIAPMLGFIGTIVGIIHIFYSISLADNISIGIIAGGLYEKMITSGSGLFVGLVAFIAYHILLQIIQRFTLSLQRDVFEFLRIITGPAA
jgi:biopolymer transport protein ExbB